MPDFPYYFISDADVLSLEMKFLSLQHKIAQDLWIHTELERQRPMTSSCYNMS